WSVEVFERELWALYRSGGDAEAAGLTPLQVQYADYALWHRELVERQAEEDLAYWRSALDDAPSSKVNSRQHSARAAADGTDSTDGTDTDRPAAGESSRRIPAEQFAGLD